jgi:hypothetical protein
MAHTSHHGPVGPDQDQLARLGYETRDIALNTLVRWLIGLFVFMGVAGLGAYGLYNLFVQPYQEISVQSPLEFVRTYPPNPQIQARPKRDMIEYRAAEEKLEKGYSKGENGTVNLPVERAMDLLAERGISGVKGSSTSPGTLTPSSNAVSGDMVNPASGSSANRDGNAGPNVSGSPQPNLEVTPPGPASSSPHTDR